MTETAPLTGGCQCGGIRYRADRFDRAVLCHCRMCQRALGNAFAWMVSTDRLDIEGTPGWFQSSSAARRGFCTTCGTPLFFQLDGAERIWVSSGSLDDPARTPPREHYGTESRHPWTGLAEELPGQPTIPGGITGETAEITSFQHPIA